MVVMISSQPLILKQNPIWVENTVVILLLICFYLVPLILLILGSKFLFKSVYLVNKKVKIKENVKIITTILFGIIFITIFPSAFFTFIYGSVMSFTNLPNSFLNILDINILYYSIAVSFSLPSDEVINMVQSEMSKQEWLKIIPSIQVVLQKLIDIFLLGYIAAILTEVIKKLSKNKT